MVRSTFLLLLGLAFTVQEANAAALANPSAFFPADATDNQPLKDFSFLLTFAEAVQYASSSVTTSITVRKAATDQGHVVRCNSPSMEVVSKYAVVPVTTEIQTASKQIVQVPSNCFRNSGFESISANYVAFDFTTITKGASSILTNDKISPGFMTAASNPSQPADQAWVTTSQDFTLYFSEMVQAGTGSWTVTAQSGTGTASFQTADMTTSAGKAMVDWTLQAIPGKIKFKPTAFSAGSHYTLTYSVNALMDLAGNKGSISTATAAPYGFGANGRRVKVSTTVSSFDPANNAATNITKYTNLVLKFAQETTKGVTGAKVSFCKQWAKAEACGSTDKVQTDKVHFLGKTVIVNPENNLADATTYNISIPSTLVNYYNGLSASAIRKWSYKFTTQCSSCVDTGKPDLVAGLVDCDGDDTLLSGVYTDTCDADRDTTSEFQELYSSVSADTALATTAKFLLYFKEAITVPAAARFTVAEDTSTTTTTVAPTVGTGDKDCVVTMDPTLKAGKLYTLTLPAKAITDSSTLKNSYDGTAFTFYTPFTTPFIDVSRANQDVNLANGDVGAAPTSTILMTFKEGTPRLGLTDASQTMTINETSTAAATSVSLGDTDKVRFMGTEIMVTPSTLKPATNYAVKLPKHSIRYMTRDFTFSFTTRAKDTKKPETVYQYPSGTVQKSTIDSQAPYVIFSEGITGHKGKYITFKGGPVAYKLQANDATCTTSGTTTGACVEIDALGSKVAFYPNGKGSVVTTAAAWSTAGKTYTVEIDAGAFSDYASTNALLNAADASSFTFSIHADAAAPTVKSIGTTATTFKTSYATQSVMFLTFNENIQSGYGYIARSNYIGGTETPALLSQTNAASNHKSATFSLTFDSPVQSASGASFNAFEYRDQVAGTSTGGTTTATPGASAVFVGNKVIFKPAATLASATSYYIKILNSALVTSAGGVALGTGATSTKTSTLHGNTASTVANMVNVKTGLSGLTPRILWSSVEDYACVGADGHGILPEITLYMNEDIKKVSTASYVKLYDCGSDACVNTDSALFSLKAYTASSTTSLKVSFGDTSKKYKLVIQGGSNTKSTTAGASTTKPFVYPARAKDSTSYFWLEQGMLTDEAASTYSTANQPTANFAWNYQGAAFAFCSAKFDTPSTQVMRLYMQYPSNPYDIRSASAPSKWTVGVPAGGGKDTVGNTGTGSSAFSFMYETTAPTLAVPSTEGFYDLQENIVLTFNEVVQGGGSMAGSFQIVDYLDANLYSSFDISIGRLTSNRVASQATTPGAQTLGSQKSVGRRVSLSPRTMCDGTPACTGLLASKTYYVKTSAAGVLRDRFGTRLAALNTKTTWKFTSYLADRSTKAPELAYTGNSLTNPTSPTTGATVTGYIYFTEQVQTNSGQFSVVDCGADLACSGASDNSAALTDSILAYGDGSSTDGTKDYGLLRYVKVLPLASRRYQITVPKNLIKDTGVTVKNGPSASYNFYVSVGTVPSPSPDAVAPTTNTYRSPANGASSVAKSSDVVLYFNEDVQIATSTQQIKFCLNSNAESTENTPACTAGRFFDSTSATFDISGATIDRRYVRLNPGKDLKIGQKLYVLFPKNAVKDVASVNNNAAKVFGTTDYAFKVADEDIVTGYLQWYSGPTLTSGTLQLFFSEAVQLGGSTTNNNANYAAGQVRPTIVDYEPTTGTHATGFNIYDSNPGTSGDLADSPGLTMTGTISGNKITFRKSWTAGRKYGLNFIDGTFKDLANLHFETDPQKHWTVSSDVMRPFAYSFLPKEGSATVDVNDVMSIMFSEVVQKGTGSISIYSKSAKCSATSTTLSEAVACKDGTIFMNSDVSSFPLLTGVNGANKYAASVLVVEPASPLTPSLFYSLKVPSTAFTDLSGNAFTGLTAYTAFETSVREEKDTVTPYLQTSSIGITPTSFASSTIVMYFTETVQATTTGYVALSSNAGVDACNSGTVACSAGIVCSTDCGWGGSPTAVSQPITALTYSGSTVTATTPTLEKGKGYKLFLDTGTFKDLTGNGLRAFDGAGTDRSINPIFVLKDTAVTDSYGPTHLTVVGKTINFPDVWPTDGLWDGTGTDSVGGVLNPAPVSTSVQITFNEVVQSGGTDQKITLSGTSNMDVYTSTCYFSATEMTCDPASDLKKGTKYEVTYLASAVKDAYGNTLQAGVVGSTGTTTASSKLAFTTVDLDMTGPSMAAAGGTSYARRLTSTPWDPYTGQANVAKGTVVAMSFTETVQSGTGSMYVYRCSTATSCAASTGTTHTIVVDGSTASTKLYFSGSSVYLDKQETKDEFSLTAANRADTTRFKVYAPNGAFKDASSRPSSGASMEFTVIADDITKPMVYVRTPKDDESTADDSPSSDVTLYFSEGVQASTSNAVNVVADDGDTTNKNTIPVDNSRPDQGKVTVVGNTVVIDPFNDMAMSSTGGSVTVTVDASSFLDLYGQGNAAITTKFKTPSMDFAVQKNHNTTLAFAPREGATMHYTAGKLMLYGGKKAGTCSSELYTSSVGKTWTGVTPTGTTPGATAFARTAMDGNGVVWMLGKGDCGDASTTILKTSDAGGTWTSLAAPASVPYKALDEEFPTTLSHHAFTIVGGWQLVVVDAVGRKVYQFVTASADTARLITDAPAWPARKDPILLSSSDNKLYLLGGHNCADDTCSDNLVNSDVWSSVGSSTSTVGETWTCETANYDPGTVETYSRGIGRFIAPLMSYDDTIFLVGGHKPNTTVGLNKVYVNYDGPPDTAISATPYAQVPATAATVNKGTSLSLYFKEAVTHTATLPLRVRSWGADKAAAGTTTNADSDVNAGITPAINRQILTITPPAGLAASYVYSVIIPDGSLTDGVGNKISSFAAYKFTINSDSTGPIVQTTTKPSGTNVAPWTNVALEMDENILVGTGSVSLTAPKGLDVSIPVEDFTLAGKTAWAPLPTGTRLTEGQTYTINVQAGNFKDAATNNGAASSTRTFSVLSSFESSSADSYTGSNTNDTVAGTGNATSDTTKPTLLSATPKASATDVPINGDGTLPTAVIMHFSEGVKYNGSGLIGIVNGSDIQVAYLNLSDTAHQDGHLKLVPNGTKVVMPAGALKKGGTFTVSVPAGLVLDFAGNPMAAALSTSFTCLSQNTDTTAPTVTMMTPTGSAYVASATSRVTMWFSEDIEAVAGGTVTVSEGNPATATKFMTAKLDSSNVTITGSKMTVDLYNLALNKATPSYYIQIPAGSLQDKAQGSEGGGNQFGGVNGTTNGFTMVVAETTAPTAAVADMLPAHETTATYGLPVSSSIRIKFSENVQLATGSVTLTPTFTSPTLKIAVEPSATGSVTTSADTAAATTGGTVAVAGTYAVVSSLADMMPGEAYAVTATAGTFTDVQGNPNAAISLYTISTLPGMQFKSQGTIGSQARYAASIAVTPDQQIYVAGGRNGTVTGQLAGAPAKELNDVWRQATYKSVHCAASYLEITPSACGTTCSSATTLSSPSIAMTVWRVPSAGGQECASTTGVTQSTLWGTVQSSSQDCLCPKCLTPPVVSDALKAQMVNDTYTSQYFGGSAFDAVYPLYCTTGYTASAGFTCAVDSTNVYVGKFGTEPTCVPQACTTGPDTASVTNLASSTCPNVSSTSDHNYNCTIKCNAGYQSKDGQNMFGCRYGTFSVTPECVEQSCDAAPTVENGKIDECTTSDDTLGTVCQLQCEAGYKQNGKDTVTCQVEKGAAAETKPVYVDTKRKAGTCDTIECKGLPTLTDPNMELDGSASGSGVEATVPVKCAAGYDLTPADGVVKCTPAGDDEVDWAPSAVSCEPVSCASATQPANGKVSCEGGDLVFGAKCSLSCDDGYALGGSADVSCGATGEFDGDGACAAAACPAVSLSTGMASTDCTGAEGKCSVTCEDSYEIKGEYNCKDGIYLSTAVCTKAGVVVETKVAVLGSITLTLVPPAGMTGEELAADPEFSANVVASLLAGLIDTPAGVGLNLEDIEIISITVVYVRRRALQAAGGAPARQLQTAKLKVDYKIMVKDAAAAAAITEEITTNKAAFQETFVAALEEKADVKVEAIEIADPVVTIEYVVPTEDTGSGAGAAAAEEEEGGGGGAMIGGIVGGIGGLALLGFCFYMYSKKNRSQE